VIETVSTEFGPIRAPFVALESCTVKVTVGSWRLSAVIAMVALFGCESPSAQERVMGAGAKSAFVAVPATGVSVTEVAPLK
jgi:hypothetical protein